MKPAMDRLIGGFCVLLAAAAPAHAQPAANAPMIVVLTPATGRNTVEDAFAQSLERLGWKVNQNVRLETRHWGGKVETLNRYVNEIVASKPAVVVMWGPQTALTMSRATQEIPIVMLSAFADPVEIGLVTNVAKPGGNVTGVTVFSTEIDAKRLQLLR